MPAPKLPLIQYWHQQNPPDYIVALLDRFREQSPGMEHLLFSEANAERFIASNYGPRELAAFHACAVPAMQADYFRYCAAHILGGVCVDVDYSCVSSLHSVLEGNVEGRLFRKGPLVINSLFGFRSPGHPLLTLVLDIVTQLIEQRLSLSVAGVTGPAAFTMLYHLNRDATKPGEGFPPRVEDYPDRFRDLAATMIDLIGDGDRLSRAFTGIDVSSGLPIQRWVRPPETRMIYKDTADDWRRAGRDIYR